MMATPRARRSRTRWKKWTISSGVRLVLRRRHRRHEAGFLIDHADAGCERVARLLEIDHFAVDKDLAGGETDRTGNGLAQRGFACAVFANQGVDLAGVEVEADALDGVHTAIDLAAVDDLEHRFAARGGPGRQCR
jgi:hypothetical protein